VADPAVGYVATVPGAAGVLPAFLAEVAITFVLMTTVLHVSNSRALNRLTGLCAGALVALYIVAEAPLSGMSMNPARTVGSAVFAARWSAVWIYFVAPVAGMLAAAQLYLATRGSQGVLCAKLHHDNDARCIFRCGWSAGSRVGAAPSLPGPASFARPAGGREAAATGAEA
jgi:aquaporin Z